MVAVDFHRLRKEQPATEVVPFSLWGGDVTVCRMDPDEILDLQALNASLPRDEKGKLSARDTVTFGTALLQKSIVDADGSKPFDDLEGERFLRGQFSELTPLWEAALRINRLTKEAAQRDQDAAKKK